MPEEVLHRFSSPTKWGNWLEANHTQKEGIWLVLQKVKSPNEGIKYNQALDEALCWGWIDGKMRRIDDNEHQQWFSPRRRDSPWSKRNRDKAEKLIEEGRMKPPGFKEIEKAKENGKWDSAYTSREPPKISPALIEALKLNKTAYDNFMAFPNSAKTTYLYWLNDAKREATKLKRIAKIVERAEKNLKPGINM